MHFPVRPFLFATALLAGLSQGLAQMKVSTDCLGELSGQECGERLNTITTAVPFLMIGPDSRSGGMGDAGVAISADANAIHWNPSKLAFAENKAEVRLSVSPWLRQLVPDMSLAYLAGYTKLKNKRTAIGGSLRYFNLGSITFTDNNGQPIREFKPAEFAFDVAFSQMFSEVFAGGIAIRYINSNLTGGLNVGGANTKPGQSVAADVSFFYRKKDFKMGSGNGTFAFGLNVSNVGAKMSYSDASRRDYIPINMRLGPCLTYDMDKYNSISMNVDVNKLLVPTPPIYSGSSRDQILSGEDPTRGVAAGILGSFSDAPGELDADSAVIDGSKLKEELREINIGGGIEYWYAKQFAFRAGYFWEHATKGNRKYFTMGVGVKYQIFSLDFSYLIANTQRSPLANTLRFTLGFNFDGKKKKTEADIE